MNTVKICGDSECRATVQIDADYCHACGGTRFIHPTKIITRDVDPRKVRKRKSK